MHYCIITKVAGDKITVKPVDDTSNCNAEETTHKKHLLCSLESAAANIVEDILAMADDRGLRNLVHIDRQPIISAYAESLHC